MKTCVMCKEGKLLTDFNKRKVSKDGLQNVCRECNRSRSRQYYRENHDKHRVVVTEKKHKAIAKAREFLVEYFSTHPCVDCGETDIRVLEFDHITADKLRGVCTMINRGFSLEKVKKEIEKCEVRCRNHHTIKTYERMGGSWHDTFMPPSPSGLAFDF